MGGLGSLVGQILSSIYGSPLIFIPIRIAITKGKQEQHLPEYN